MVTKGSATRSRLLGVGLDRLSVEGLSGVTIGTLASEAGISKSGLFAHFSSKEELQLQLLDETMRLADSTVIAPAMAKKAGLPRLIELFHRWLGWSTRAGLSGGCPIAAAIFELDDLDGPVRARVVELEEHTRRLLEGLVAEAIAGGELDRRTDPAQVAWEMTGIYLAHHASSRLAQNAASAERAKTAFKALLARAGASTRRR
jgi:AcrR family transcriptional regulator